MLAEWANIATWTALCEGPNCVDAIVPYRNFNDWFHFSAGVDVTVPGTPQYVAPLSTDPAENENNMTPDFSWPCVFNDPGDCGWDYGPPTPPEKGTNLVLPTSPRHPDPFGGNSALRPVSLNISNSGRSDGYPYGRAEHQPPNVPPPVYVMGKPLPLHLKGPDAYAVPENLDDFVLADESDGIPMDDPLLASNLTGDGSSPVINTITPDICQGPIDTPTILPTLTYFCEFLPNICANIRSHSDWPSDGSESMILTYDPFSASTDRRRRGVCTRAVKDQFQTRVCDKQQHDPSFWHVSTLSHSMSRHSVSDCVTHLACRYLATSSRSTWCSKVERPMPSSKAFLCASRGIRAHSKHRSPNSSARQTTCRQSGRARPGGSVINGCSDCSILPLGMYQQMLLGRSTRDPLSSARRSTTATVVAASLPTVAGCSLWGMCARTNGTTRPQIAASMFPPSTKATIADPAGLAGWH